MNNEKVKSPSILRSITIVECTKEMVHLSYHHRENPDIALKYSQIALNLSQVNYNLKLK